MKNDTLLLRQIHPSFVQGGRITSQAFRPNKKDKKKLSVYDNDMISPENAFRHYTEQLNYKSDGVMAVSVTECLELELPVEPDSKTFPEHVLIDFSNFAEAQIKKKAKLLKVKADSRGWMYYVN
jgi:hypothetical protein